MEGDIIDVGTTVLADDVCETNITNDAQHMLMVEQISTEAQKTNYDLERKMQTRKTRNCQESR